MPAISNLPAVTTFTGTMIFPVVDVDVTPDTTKQASFGQLRDYILLDVSVSSVAGKTGAVDLDWADVGGLATVSTSGSYTDLINLPAVFPVTTATSSIKGGVKIGSGISVTSDGTISTSIYSLTSATSSALGGVKIGSGISITNDGTISTVPMTTATGSVLGGIKVGTNLSVTADGVLSVTNNTASPFTITSTDANALQVYGGAIINGAVYADNLFANNKQVITTATIGNYSNVFNAGTGTAIGVTGVNVNIWSTENLQSITNKNSSTSNPISITNTTSSTSTVSGALIVTGGVGVGGAVYAGNIYSNGVQLTAGSYLTVKNEGTNLTTAATSIDFVGAGVTATNVGDAITVTISGGSGGATFDGGTVSGATQFTDTTDSTSTSTGAVTIAGGLGVGGNVNVANTLTTQSLQVNGSSTPRVYSASNLNLEAVGRVQVTQSPFKIWNVTETERDAIAASNGDLIYNTDTHKFQGYANGAWVDLN